MPKGNSGFQSAAFEAGVAVGKGVKGSWRLTDQTKFAKDIQSIYKSMYRSNIILKRDGRGKVIGWSGTDEAMLKAGGRIQALAERMSKELQIYNPEQQQKFDLLKQQYGKAMRVTNKDWKEFLGSRKSGDLILISNRGKRGVASGADSRALEAGHTSDSVPNVLKRANEALNNAKRALWRNATQGEQKAYEGDIYESIMNNYAKVERSGLKKRR